MQVPAADGDLVPIAEGQPEGWKTKQTPEAEERVRSAEIQRGKF